MAIGGPHSRPVSFKIGLAIIVLALTVSGCAKRLPMPDSFIEDYPGPQLGVTPISIRLGISTLLKTQLVIVGKGFKPGDSVFVDMLSDNDGEDALKIPIDAAEVDETGQFIIEVSKDIKTLGILRCDIDATDMTPIVVRSPIPTGSYFLKATSVISDRRAECMITTTAPSKMDKFKDKIGGWFGRIRFKR